MTSTITFLGHSGLDVRLGDARVVCDPWLSPRGAYLSNWHQFPANDHLAAGALHDTPTLFVSSPRPDHFDAETLRAFPTASVRVVIPKLASPALANRLRELGFADLRELADGEWIELADGARLSVVGATTRHLLGAALVLEREGEVIVDQNDCLLDDAALEKLAALAPALHLLRFSGGSYFPAAYDLPPETMRAEAARERDRLAAQFFDAAVRVGARQVVAMGGPPCFVDERGFPLNFADSIFFDADELAARAAAVPGLTDRLRLAHPGDVAGRQGEGWSFPSRRPYADKRAHLEEIRRARAPLREAHLAELRAQAEPVDTKELRAYLRDFFQFEDMTAELKVIVQFRLTDGPSVWIDFRNKPYRYLTECDEPADYVLSTESAWVSLVLQGKLTWHELLMGHQMSVARAPERQAPKLMQHFDYRHDEALFDLVRLIDPALITVQDETMEYVCQRFCPHRGRDLDYAIVERGVLTCTAHGWRFDLRKGGRCLWGGETPLLVKEVRPLKG